MRTAAVITGIAAMFIVLCPPQANGQVQVGISATDRGLQSFYLAIGEYYRVPEREVVVIRGRHIPDEEIPFVNLRFVTEHYGYDPPAVMRMRGEGKSFVIINDEVKTRSHGRGKDDKGEGKGRGQGKGKGKHKGGKGD